MGYLVAKAQRMMATTMRTRQIVCLLDECTSGEMTSLPADGVQRKQSASRSITHQSFASNYIMLTRSTRKVNILPTSTSTRPQKVGMSLAIRLSPDLTSTICYTLSYEERNDDIRRFDIVGVYERATHAVAALIGLRLQTHNGPVAEIDQYGGEFPNANKIGPLGDPEDPQNRQIGRGYRFRKPDTDDIATIWIKEVYIMREVTDYGQLGPSEIVNWTQVAEESRIDTSDDTNGTNGHVNLNGSGHGYVEEID